MAKLIYDNSAMKRDTPDNSLQHWKYIKRERVGGKWKYTYKDDEKGKDGATKTATAVTPGTNNLVAKKKPLSPDERKNVAMELAKAKSKRVLDKRMSIGGKKAEIEKLAADNTKQLTNQGPVKVESKKIAELDKEKVAEIKTKVEEQAKTKMSKEEALKKIPGAEHIPSAEDATKPENWKEFVKSQGVTYDSIPDEFKEGINIGISMIAEPVYENDKAVAVKIQGKTYNEKELNDYLNNMAVDFYAEYCASSYAMYGDRFIYGDSVDYDSPDPRKKKKK